MAAAAALLVGTALCGRGQASTTHNFYDTAGRFIGSTVSSNGTHSFSYDPADNRTSAAVSFLSPRTSSQQLSNNQALTQGEALVSADGRFTCVLQEDGNVVIVQGGTTALWSTGTSQTNGAWFDMQSDGNLVLYDIQGAVLWQSKTGNTPGAQLVMQSDGNLVIHTTNNVAIWNSGTGGH